MSPYTSIKDLASDLVGKIGKVHGEIFPSLRKIREYKSPVLIIHGEQDEVIPVKHGKTLYTESQKVSPLARGVFPLHMTHNLFDMERDILEPIGEFLEECDKYWESESRGRM